MRILLTFIFLMIGGILHAQDVTGLNTEKDTTYTMVEHMPEYPGGESAMYEFLQTNIQYPEEARKKKISGRVYINFVVDKSGKVRNVSVLRGVDPLLDEEAVRVISKFPKWTPGMQDGVPVSVSYNMPLNFSLKH